VKLWSYWRSSSAYRVRIALGLKNLAYTYQAIHLTRDGGEQNSAGFEEFSPLRQIPVLEVTEGGETFHLVQSLPIIEYLEERFPEPPLLPKPARDRAHVRALAELVNSGIQPLQNAATFAELKARGVDSEQWAKAFIARGLNGLEALGKARAGAFLFGDSVTLADVFLVPQLYNARRFGIPLDPYPSLLRAETSAQALPAFQVARPEAQPDAESA
jgi:maleylpyruvate isomerase